MKPASGRVIISHVHKQFVEPHEIEAATVLADYFTCEVLFIPPIGAYKIKTPDLDIRGKLWELKTPRGNSRRHTIKRHLKRGKRQSRNIIIDTRKTILDDNFITKELANILKQKDIRLHGLMLIDKNKKVHILKQ